MTAKQPQAGEWWQADDGSRARIIGVMIDGDVMYETKIGRAYNGGYDWSDWQHLPDCDSFEWKPEVSDPGEGWDLLAAGTKIEVGDEYCAPDGIWRPSGAIGYHVRSECAPAIYRRKIKPAEVWPQYWTSQHGDSERPVAYVVRQSKDIWMIKYKDGTSYVFDVLPWSERDRKQITKEQAEALLSPVESPPVEIPTNQQLFEMITNLRDQMDAMSKTAVTPNRTKVRLFASANMLHQGSNAVVYASRETEWMDMSEILPDGDGGWYVEVQS